VTKSQLQRLCPPRNTTWSYSAESSVTSPAASVTGNAMPLEGAAGATSPDGFDSDDGSATSTENDPASPPPSGILTGPSLRPDGVENGTSLRRSSRSTRGQHSGRSSPTAETTGCPTSDGKLTAAHHAGTSGLAGDVDDDDQSVCSLSEDSNSDPDCRKNRLRRREAEASQPARAVASATPRFDRLTLPLTASRGEARTASSASSFKGSSRLSLVKRKPSQGPLPSAASILASAPRAIVSDSRLEPNRAPRAGPTPAKTPSRHVARVVGSVGNSARDADQYPAASFAPFYGSFKEFIAATGFNHPDVRRDGDCQPLTIARHVFGKATVGHANTVRAMIAEYADAHPLVQRSVAATEDMSYEEFRSSTVTQSTWLWHVHLMLAEEVWDMRFDVFQLRDDGAVVLFLPGNDESHYEAIAHRPRRAVLFCDGNHYRPLIHKGSDTPVTVPGSTALAAAREPYRRQLVAEHAPDYATVEAAGSSTSNEGPKAAAGSHRRVSSVAMTSAESTFSEEAFATRVSAELSRLLQLAEKSEQTPVAHNYRDVLSRSLRPVDASERGQGGVDRTPAQWGRLATNASDRQTVSLARATIDEILRREPLITGRPTVRRTLTFEPPLDSAASTFGADVSLPAAPAAKKPRPDPCDVPLFENPIPRTQYTPLLGSSSADSTGAMRLPVPALMYPHLERHRAVFEAPPPPEVINPELYSSLEIKDTYVLGDDLVLVSGKAALSQAPSSWAELAVCSMGVYRVTGGGRDRISLEFQRRLCDSRLFGRIEWPQSASVSSASDWWFCHRGDASTLRTAFGTATPRSGAPLPQPTPLGASPPRSVMSHYASANGTFAEVAEAGGIMHIADPLGVHHKYTKNPAPQRVLRTMPISLFAGPGRLRVLTSCDGAFVGSYTADMMIPASIAMERDRKRAGNPRNTNPDLPMSRQHWVAHKGEADLGMRVLCFEWCLLLLGSGPPLRLAHFLPTADAASLPAGRLSTWHQLLQALQGIGEAYACLYNVAYFTEFEALVSTIKQWETGRDMSPTFLEDVILERLVAFRKFAQEDVINSPTTLPFHQEPFIPSALTPPEWALLMRLDIFHALDALTEQDDLSYQRAAARTPEQGLPTGFKASAAPAARPNVTTAGAGQQSKGKTGAKKQRDTHAAPSAASGSSTKAKGEQLCAQDLLHHYGISSTPCRRASCGALHHAELRGFPFAKAAARIRAASLGDAQEATLLEHMEKDTVKFPPKDVNDRAPGARNRNGKRNH
jgi:hypothetical protein